MSEIKTYNKNRFAFQNIKLTDHYTYNISKISELLNINNSSSTKFLESLPFSINDITAGTEDEYQTSVEGSKEHVDLPLTIKKSNYFRNIIKRTVTGESSKKTVTELEKFLDNNDQNIWENSWVNFPRRVLCKFAANVFNTDLLFNKDNINSTFRNDISKFIFYKNREEFVRIPVSYLLKLSLAEFLGSQKRISKPIRECGERLLNHFLNDNTSPEINSFYIIKPDLQNGIGSAIAKESAKRYLLVQLLTIYAEQRFLLKEYGQKVKIYFSPHPPVRLKNLNQIISDSFYRELFMNPCLSGWPMGENKYHYMHLCHQVLSRSQLNAVVKLREANIIRNNLVILPNTSNISLANNGTHLSLGSIKLTEYLKDSSTGFTKTHEKYIGDLVIKIMEHFLPLFVRTYSAAPYRLDFTDFFPEKVLGFLPHELDYTHLRMIWRRWRKKAKLKCFGQPITPFGPGFLDKFIRFVFRFKGDFVPDFRLINYLVSLISTDQSPVLDGTLENESRLKKDLDDLGVFDKKMSIYLLYKLREFEKLGFSGFEGRHYSLFYSLKEDISKAANLQILLNALAFKYIFKGFINHLHIPDNPTIESERRQIFFGAAIGIPTFYIKRDTNNIFLKKIIKHTEKVRYSKRYSGYVRVYNKEYCKALVSIIEEDAADLIEMFKLKDTINDLHQRINEPGEFSTAGKLTNGILKEFGVNSPLNIKTDKFNQVAEKYFRDNLRKFHIEESMQVIHDSFKKLENLKEANEFHWYNKEIFTVLGINNVPGYLKIVKNKLINNKIPMDDLNKLIYLMLITIDFDSKQ